ncbi:MAG: DUF1828 domain-containing protein [Burkholderiaceae bacterium]|nr:DUF1828 domain-containing protein [Burkholderiaceae bacterium]
MNCADITSLLGFHCAQIEGGGLVLTTPYLLPNGASIPVFIEPTQTGGFRLWDAGELLFEAIASGVQLRSHSGLRGLRTKLERHGATLHHDGCLEVLADKAPLPVAFGSYIAAAFEVARWHQKVVDRAPSHDVLIEETAGLLIEASPKEPVQRNIEIPGLSEQIWTFDLKQSGQLIDCISAHPTAGAHEVKKLVDVRGSEPYQDTDILVVVDDRADPERADQEIRVISRLADAMPFTSLRQKLNPPALAH